MSRRLTRDQQRLVEEHVGLAKQIAKQTCRGFDPDARLSAAYLGLCEAARKAKAAKDFPRFAAHVIRQRILKDRGLWFGHAKLRKPLTGMEHGFWCLVVWPSESKSDARMDAEIYRSRFGCLTTLQRSTLDRYCQGESWSEIARSLGRSKLTVAGNKREAVRKLRTARPLHARPSETTLPLRSTDDVIHS